MARVGVVPGPEPMQVHLYADSLVEEYGEYGCLFYLYGSVERQGVPVVVSSNAPVTMPGPLRAARSHADATQGASHDAALRGITRTADLPVRRDLGSLTVGSRADLVLLDSDPFTAPVDVLATAAVTETLVGGEQVWTQEGTS
jgi:predicted amidohydrolase YtcJ